MKQLYFAVMATAICLTSFAQSRVATADYQKTKQPGIETDVPFSEKTITSSLEDYFQKLGYKGKDTKGYMTYRGVHLPQLGPGSYDLYFKADRKSRKEKDACTVTMLISGGFDKFIGDTTNAALIDSAKNYLNGLTVRVAAYDLEQQIVDQEDAVKKAAKSLSSLTETADDLQKKKSKLENDIAENIKKQASQKTEMEKQQQILQTLKEKRRQ
ncbi:MAG: hypothetical protein JWR61_951 [Ferruginibacter sp.]|uniref:hypothetical protein n=1 Tax=Ferruginibacter sp. TaxID=1940288 RepID=UPI00265805A7|nr:hypothetical protein [Ferruginibacter sp.]MDB5275996.1 hypothetical protein [Ferruginibacter sp.]